MDKSCRVIIINFNAGEALLRCVASVLATREPLHIVVADNQSSDGSCEVLRSRFGSAPRMSILENPVNLGFGRAVNACAHTSTEPYLLILNPDCELFPDTLVQLRDALERDASAALAAPRIVDDKGKVMRGTLRKLPTPWRALMTGSGMWRLTRWFPAFAGVEVPARAFPKHTSKAEAVSGACMLVKADTFRSMGGFDESFTMHFEDLDLMTRIQKAGMHCLFVPQASAIHLAGISSASRPLWVHRQKHLSLQRYFGKHAYESNSLISRFLVTAANWLHYMLGLPFALFRQFRV